MHKLFDKMMTSRIKEVFQNHQEAYRPGDWEKMRAKMLHEKKTIAIWFPIVAKAASIVLFLGLSVFTVNDIKNENSELGEAKISIPKNDTILPELTDNNVKTNVITNIKHHNSKINNKKSNIANYKESFNNNEELVVNNEKLIVINDTLNLSDSSDVKFANIKNELNKQREEIKKMENKTPDSSKIKLYNDDYVEFVDDKKTDKRFEFGVELASVSNYAAEGTGTNLNVGGGVSTSWHIMKNLSLTTGVLISRQSMNYNQSKSSNMLMANKDANYASPNTTEMIDVNTAESKLEFVGIDIPLNVQFRHKRLVLTTGVSSILYVQEKYNNSYSSMLSNTTYNMALAKYETQNTANEVSYEEKSSAFSHFDFASLLNLAVGYNIPLSKGGLTFEPYLKLPIGSISSYQVKMGSGGLALRYYF